MENVEARSLITRLSTAFDKHLGPERYTLYVERLQEWDFEVGRRAINGLIDSEDRFPSLNKILTAAQNQASSQPDRPRHDRTLAKDWDRTLTPGECAIRRQRCMDLVYRKYSPECLKDARQADWYWRQRLDAFESELDAMAAVEPVVDQFDQILYAYYSAQCRMGEWSQPRAYRRPSLTTGESHPVGAVLRETDFFRSADENQRMLDQERET